MTLGITVVRPFFATAAGLAPPATLVDAARQRPLKSILCVYYRSLDSLCPYGARTSTRRSFCEGHSGAGAGLNAIIPRSSPTALAFLRPGHEETLCTRLSAPGESSIALRQVT